MSRRRPFLYVWRDAIACLDDLTTAQRCVAWRSSDYADPDGANVYPGSIRLAVECGLKVQADATQNSTVDGTFKKLVDLGYAVKVKAGYRGQNAEYRLTLPPESNRPHGSISGESNRESAPKATVPTGPTNPLPGEASW